MLEVKIPRCFCWEPLNPGRSTCGNSYCQEADFFRNAARNAKKRDRVAAGKIANEKIAIAARMGKERGGPTILYACVTCGVVPSYERPAECHD